MTAGGVDFDRSRFPLVHCRFTGPVDPAGAEQLLVAFRAMLDEGRRYVAVIDFAESNMRPTPVLRRMAGDFIAELNQRKVVLAHAVVFVTPNQAWRGALTAVFWVAKPVVPTHVVAHREQGLAIARGVLAGAGEALPGA